MRQNRGLIKKMGMTALLVSTLAISNPASALNATIGNSSADNNLNSDSQGQSFRNDPSGTGATINLNTWTFAFFNATNQSTAAGLTLTIRNGTGNGGTIVGTSTSASTAAVTGYTNPVTWTFTGGLQIVDTSTYTAVLAPTLRFLINQNNPYRNGVFTQRGNGISFIDAVFQGGFSAATPVPFEFSPALGLVSLGALWLVKKKFAKKTK